jgi:hypothetical protein
MSAVQSSSHRTGHLADNVVHFVRVLRDSGLTVGPERSVLAQQALLHTGLDSRTNVHAALSAILLNRHEDQPIFDMAFAAFWRDPKLLERLMYLTLPKVAGRGEPPALRARRLEEALAGTSKPAAPPPSQPKQPDEPVELDAILTYSERERLQSKDFESMTAQEYAMAKQAAARSQVLIPPLPTRRERSARRGRLDLRATMRRGASGLWRDEVARVKARTEPARVVILCDISGSMDRYARLFLHWAHALGRHHPRLHVFTLGTRLTNISRALRSRDVDQAMALASAQVQDWSGGTRLASTLARFNHDWARRVLGSRSLVLLLTDGLDRDDAGDLAQQAALLRRFAPRIVWLNPLLRFDGFEPKASGIRALLPQVDEFVAVHNLNSLHDLETLLARPPSLNSKPTWNSQDNN